MRFIGRRQLMQLRHVFRKPLIVLGGIGQRAANCLVPKWRKDDKARLGPGDFTDDINESLHLLPKFRRLILKRTGHAVPKKNHRRLHQLNLFLQLLPAFIRRLTPSLQQRQPRPRNPTRRVARPAEIAKRDMPLEPSRGQCQFQVPVFLRALNEHIANERHAIAILELKSGDFSSKGRLNNKYCT